MQSIKICKKSSSSWINMQMPLTNQTIEPSQHEVYIKTQAQETLAL